MFSDRDRNGHLQFIGNDTFTEMHNSSPCEEDIDSNYKILALMIFHLLCCVVLTALGGNLKKFHLNLPELLL